MMEKYSSYQRMKLEANGQTLLDQWNALKVKLVKDCDIKRTHYHLDLEDEKLIGKAKVSNPVITPSEAFLHLKHINVNAANAFLFKRR